MDFNGNSLTILQLRNLFPPFFLPCFLASFSLPFRKHDDSSSTVKRADTIFERVVYSGHDARYRTTTILYKTNRLMHLFPLKLITLRHYEKKRN